MFDVECEIAAINASSVPTKLVQLCCSACIFEQGLAALGIADQYSRVPTIMHYAYYRVFIEAWSAYAGPAEPRPPKTLASHDYLMRIEDPAIRSIMQAIIAERDKLKAQLNVLKANAQVTVDRRPLGATISASPGAEPVAVLTPSAQLTPSEREALLKAVSAGYLEERGLKEGSHGEIVNERGRTVFEVGFARAIREILGC